MASLVEQFNALYPELIRGDSIELPLFFNSGVTGLPIDVTGWTLSYTAKLSPDDSDDNALVKHDYTFPEPDSPELTGKVLFIVPASKTEALVKGTVYHDLQLTIPASPEPIIKTSNLDRIKVVADITRRIPGD